MKTHIRLNRRALTGAVIAAMTTLVMASTAHADQRIVLTGSMTESETAPRPQAQAGFGAGQISLQDVCSAASIAGQYAGAAEVELANQMARAGVPSDLAADAREALGDAMEDICNDPEREPQWTSSPFTLIYASCMMRMETPANGMAIRLVPSAGEAIMEMVDYGTGEAHNLLMNYDIGRLQSVTGDGSATALQMNATGQSKSILGYNTREHTFSYTMSMGDEILRQMGGDQAALSGMLGGMTDMMKVTTSGRAWLASDAPGAGIVSDFYDNLAGITEDGLGNSFFTGMLRNLAGLVKDGIPLETRTRVQGAMGMNSVSTSVIESLQVDSMDAGECAQTIIPEGYPVTSISDQVDAALGGQRGATGGTPGGMSEEDAASMNEAMGELNKALEGMTPEQRQAMESMGLGGLLGGAAGNAPGAGSAAAAPAAAAATTSGSASMMSDDLGQSAQRMLQALGYEPGNTSGNIDTATVIAISQFQAENGMAVTGEVTPQLIGVLSAKVDAQ